jgi:hypothetical protein
MSEIHERKELKDIMRKCRCCLRLLIDDRRAVEIDETIRENFHYLTQIQVLIQALIFIFNINQVYFIATES